MNENTNVFPVKSIVLLIAVVLLAIFGSILLQSNNPVAIQPVSVNLPGSSNETAVETANLERGAEASVARWEAAGEAYDWQNAIDTSIASWEATKLERASAQRWEAAGEAYAKAGLNKSTLPAVLSPEEVRLAQKEAMLADFVERGWIKPPTVELTAEEVRLAQKEAMFAEFEERGWIQPRRPAELTAEEIRAVEHQLLLEKFEAMGRYEPEDAEGYTYEEIKAAQHKALIEQFEEDGWVEPGKYK